MSCASTVAPNARHNRATVWPTAPQPRTPTTADDSCRPPGWRHVPSLSSRASGTTARHRRDHERDRQLGDRLTVHAGRPAHGDAVAARGVEVDHVEADAVLADQAQLRHGAKHRVAQDVEPGDRARVPAKKRHQLVAGEDAVGVVEPRAADSGLSTPAAAWDFEKTSARRLRPSWG